MKEKSVIKNASWIIGCRILKSLISFIIGVFTVRYLGPSNYGLLNYVTAIVAFATPIMQLGFPSVLVNEMINNPEDEGKILGTSLLFNIVSAVFSIIGIMLFVTISNAGEETTILVCFLYSLILIFQAGEMTQYWFQTKLLSKYSATVSLAAYIVVSVYKVFLLVLEKSIVWFVLTHVIEAVIISILLFVLYRKLGNQKLSFSFSLGRALFSKSKYYVLSGLMLIVFTQTDKIMLKEMIGETETGYYSAALACIGITSFVFTAILDSARPSIFDAKRHSYEAFEKQLSLLFSVVIYISLLQSIFMTIFADLIVSVLYGQAYLPAATVLKFAVWYVTFSNIGNVESIWIVSENKQKYLPIINLFGAALNIIVNALLIPRFGACGAAIASVATQLFSKGFLFIIIKPMRPIGKIMLKSFNPVLLTEFVGKRIRK